MKLGLLALLGSLGLLAQGCIVVAEDGHHHHVHTSWEFSSASYSDEGALTLDWSVDGETHPAFCDDFDAESLELAIYDTQDSLVDVVVVPCSDFGTSLDLEEDWYSIDVTLLDRYDDPVTTTLTLDDVDVIADDELVISVDFPYDSLL